jgi:cobalt-zinc-cadmium efflux system membrane fusion protein
MINHKEIVLILLIFAGCGTRDQSADEGLDDTIQTGISITKDQMEEIGLEIGNLKLENISAGVAVNGYLDTPPQYKANVSSIIDGRITRIHFLPGDYVGKGQEVIRMESPDFLRLQQNYIEVRGELEYLKNEYERQKKLSESNVSAKKIFLQAERDYHSKIAEFSSLGNQLKLLNTDPENLNPDQLSSIVKLRAPINGYISEIFASLGEFIPSEDEVFRIVNPEHMHAELNVFEKDILKIKKGQKVEIRLPQMMDSVLLGEVFLVGRELDEESRALNVHVHIPENDQLVVGMYIEATIFTSEEKVYVVPNDALILEERGTSIFVVSSQTDENYLFRKVPVETGSEKDGKTQVFLTEQLSGDTKIAISGVYYLTSNE